MSRHRRSVPGRQESFDPSAVVTRCPRCVGREPNVATCTTCGGTGEVTLLPRAKRATRVRLDLTLEEAQSLLDGSATPAAAAALAAAISRARERGG